MKQVTYTGNDLAREVPTMREPKADDYTDFAFPDSAYYLALEAYGRHLASLQTIPVLPGHNWIEGQTYEEGRDYVTTESLEWEGCSGFAVKTMRTVLQPIVNVVASDNKASPSLASHSCTEGNSIEQIYQWALNNKIDAELAKKDESDQLSKMFLSGVIAAFNDLLNYIPNPEGSDATPDPSSNEDD